jgi:hypothetical protein
MAEEEVEMRDLSSNGGSVKTLPVSAKSIKLSTDQKRLFASSSSTISLVDHILILDTCVAEVLLTVDSTEEIVDFISTPEDDIVFVSVKKSEGTSSVKLLRIQDKTLTALHSFQGIAVGISSSVHFDQLYVTVNNHLEFEEARSVLLALTFDRYAGKITAAGILASFSKIAGCPGNVSVGLVSVHEETRIIFMSAFSVKTCSAFDVIGISPEGGVISSIPVPRSETAYAEVTTDAVGSISQLEHIPIHAARSALWISTGFDVYHLPFFSNTFQAVDFNLD